MGFTLPESVTWNKIEKAELVITTTSVKNDANHTSFPKAWLYGADYSAFENGVQYEGTDNAPTYNTAEILEFDSPTVNGESKYDITEYIKTMKENNTAFRIDVKSQNSNNTWLIGSCTNGAKAPQLILTLKEETEPTTEPSGKPTTTPDIKPTDETINITADKTAQWIANSGDSKSYDLDIHGWETWETAAYIGFTLPDDFVPSEIGTAKLIVNTTSAAGSGPGRAYAAYYDGFDNGGYYEGVDRLPGYINTKTIAKFDTPAKNVTGDFEIDITSYIRGLGDAKNAAVRLDAESGQVNMRWKIGSCKTGTAPRLVLKKGEYTEPTPEPTEEPLTEPDAKPTAEFINLDFTDGLNGWTTSVKGDTVGSVSAENGTAILGNKSSVYQIANGLVQGSYTMNVWVKGTATGNTSYIRAEETGGPAAESKVDTFINSSGYTCISLRNVLVYNGQCKIKIFSGKGCSLTLDKVEFVLDSNDNNPVLNWGFENGLENWTTDGTVDIIETDADTGSKAAKLAPNSEISQTIAVKPNTRYIATVRAKVDTQDTWEKVETYYTDGANKGKKSGEYSVTLTNGDRINLGVRNASGVVLRQAPAGLEGYSLLTIAFKTGADDTSVTLYANTKYGDSYKNSVKVYGDGATGDAWTRNKGNAYIDNFDFFTREESVVLGIDVSYLPIIEDNNGKYYANGVQQDFLAIMSNRGVTAVNGMIFVHGGADAMKPGTNSVALTMPNGFDKYYWYEIAERAKALDMDYMANFMLSDVWMNAVSAYTPIDWMRWNKEKNIYENQTLDEMKTSMYNYIYDFLDGLKQRNITPIAVKIGNEEDGGICWNVGKYTKDSYNITKGFQELINSGYDAAHDVFPDAPAFLHTYQGYNTSYSKKWFNAMDTAGVQYDGRAYSLYGLSPTHNILAMLNQDNEIAPYQDTMHVETGIQATYHEADNVGNDTKHVQLDYWSATPNGQYNYLLEYMQGLKDIPNPHSVMRGVFWWAAEWLEVEGAGWIVDDGCSVGGRTLVNNGDPNIHEMGSAADGKPGDVYESAYSYLWRGEAKNKQADAATPLKGYGKYTVTKADKPTSIIMEKSKITLTEGEFEKLHITLAPSNAVYNWTVNWTSSNEAVATVGEHGVVKALGEGTAMITAVTEDGKLTASCEVTVLPSVKATNDDITIELEAYGKTVNGETIGMLTDNLMKLNITLPEAVKNQTVKVTSSNPDAITFLGEHWQPNEKGVLYQQTDETTAIELNSHTEGTSVITVTADGGASKSFTVTITENNMSDISELIINKAELQLEATFSEKLDVYIYPQNASGNKITWISENEAIATVDDEGKVTGINVGETVITASAGGHSVKCKVTVTPTSQIKRTITTEGDITLDSDDIYRFPGSAAAIKTDFTADKGKITIEFDAQLLKDSGKYTELIIKDNADNSIITWKCSEYGGEENLYYVQTGDFEAKDKDTAFTGVINGESTETAYTHFKSVIDLDLKTAVLYLSNQKVASGTITSDNVAGFSIYSNHKWRPISVKNISIIGENTVPKGPHINELYTSLDKDGVLNYSLSYEGTEKSTVYIALYDEDGALVKCTSETGGKIQLDRFGKYQMKALLWEDMKPLDKAVTRDIDYSDMGGYLFVHFIGKESTADEEQIYFSLSEDGQNWQTLNNGNQYLESTVGEKGVRDPHIIRSPEGDKFYIIATDLGIYNRRDDDDRWNTCQREGSKGIVVWESSDLINWSEPRLANVMGDDCGCVWAPECIYDKEKGEYMVYWASRTSADNYQWLRAYRSYTKDFVTFTEPELWIDHATSEQMANNTALHTFDMTILEHNGKYYRFTKTNTVTMEETDSLSGEWKTVENYELYKTVSNYEGPTVYKANGEDKWYMLLDCLSNNNKGYKPFVTTDIANGAFSQAADFNFDVTYRHGTVIPITRTEYRNLTK